MENHLNEPVKKLCRTDAKIVEVTHDENLTEAFKKLVDNKLLSAPCKQDGKYIGFLDLRDLVSMVCFVAEQKDEQQAISEKGVLNVMLSPKNLTAAKFPEQAKSGISCQYMARRNKFVEVAADAPISALAELLRNNKRVAVMAADGSIMDIISQSTLVAFVVKHAPKLLPDISATQIGSAPVISVTSTDSALAAFKLMDKHTTRGLAMVDPQGKIVGNTSASDLKRCLGNFSAPELQEPVFEYMKKIRQKDLLTRPPVITVKSTDSLATVVGKLAATKLHRIFVVDENQVPLRVITLTDVIRALPA